MSTPTGFRNPVVPGFNPDPSIVRVHGDYFLITSSFEYFPGIPIYHSTDLVNWSLIGHALSRPSQLDLRSCEPGTGIQAPTIRYNKGRFYVTACAVHRTSPANATDTTKPRIMPRSFYVSTSNIWKKGSWSDPIYFDVLGIDPDLFFDDNGKTFLSVSGLMTDPAARQQHKGIPLAPHIVEVELATGNSLGPLTLLRAGVVGNGVSEGSHLLKKNGLYYLLTADGGTEVAHQEWICRNASSPLGPWEVGPGRVNPLVFNDEHPEVQQTGHMDMVEGPDGRWWAVFLGVRPVKDGDKGLLSQLGRETFLAPVTWKDDWPVVNDGQPISLTGSSSANLTRVKEHFQKSFLFSPGQDIHKEGWYHLRTPQKKAYDLDAVPGSIALYGGPYDLRVDENVTMLLQKQTAFQGVWEVTLDYQPCAPGHEAGTTVWWSKWAFASAGIRGVKSQRDAKVEREMVFRFPEPEGDEFKETVAPIEGPAGPVHFRIVAEPTRYTFLAGADSTSLREIGSISSRVLVRTRPFDAIFTGTHLGIYAVGADNQGSWTSALFSGITWSGLRAGGK